MKAPPLFFVGHAFPVATITEWNSTPERPPRVPMGPAPVIGHDKLEPRGWSEPCIATIKANGKGRHWRTSRLRGFWRNFATLNHQDEKSILPFIRRYGDPIGRLPEKSDTLHWARIQVNLGLLASAWDPEDAEEISHRTTNEDRLTHIRSLFANPDTGPTGSVDFRFDRTGTLRFEPRTLEIFMTVSAMLMFQMRMPMRRCSHCDDWYGITDVRARFCSNACRNAAQRVKVADTGLSVGI